MVSLFNQKRKQKDGRQRDAIIVILFAILSGLGIFFATKSPVYAGIQLSAFEVLVLSDGVILEWQTVSENDLLGFEIWYKQEEQSQSAYQFFGKRIAQGSLQRSVTYRMDVTRALKEGNVYCFQLRELPLSGERGEIHNRCGYGLGISAKPTPTPTPIFTATPVLTATTMLTMPMPLTGTVDPYPSYGGPTTTLPTDTLPVQPNDGTEGAGVVVPTPFNQSPLPTPPDIANWAVTPASSFQEQSPLPTPITPLTTTGFVTMSAGAVDAAALNDSTDLFSQTQGLTTTLPPATDGSGFTSPLPVPTEPIAAAPNPPYIVLTATPTTAATEPAPTFTPYPTGQPEAQMNVLGLQRPDTESLMIMLLCGVFSGASGLGILGLVSTLLYMRSRAAGRSNRSNQHHF